jgi:beta-lactamase regulating signal transducer with metallopeptidase domain
MLTELIALAQTWTTLSIVLGLQTLFVLVLRKPVRAWLGSVACYRLWLVMLTCLPVYFWGPGLAGIVASAPAPGQAQGDAGMGLLPEFLRFDLLTFDSAAALGKDTAADGGWPFNGWIALALVWVTGAMAILTAQTYRWVKFSRVVRAMATPLTSAERNASGTAAVFGGEVPALWLPYSGSAALFGVLRPSLLLPEAFCQRHDANQRHVILAHEAVHRRRHDNGWNLLGLLLMAAFWINPLVFVAWRCFRLDQELSCDALALQRCNKEQQRHYARTLLDSLGLLTPSHPQPALSAWDNLNDLKERSVMVNRHLLTVTRPVTSFLALSLTLLLGACMAMTGAELGNRTQSSAQDGTQPNEQPEAQADSQPARQLGTQAEQRDLDQDTARVLGEAYEHFNSGRVAEARERLDSMSIEQLSPYEKSRLHQLLFSLDMKDEDYTSAREHIQLTLDSGGLSAQETIQMQYQSCQLYFATENWAAGAECFSRHVEQPGVEPNRAPLYLIAIAHYQLSQFEEALVAMERAMAVPTATPQKPHYELMAALYVNAGRYPEAVEVYEELVKNWDEPKHREQLDAYRVDGGRRL